MYIKNPQHHQTETANRITRTDQHPESKSSLKVTDKQIFVISWPRSENQPIINRCPMALDQEQLNPHSAKHAPLLEYVLKNSLKSPWQHSLNATLFAIQMPLWLQSRKENPRLQISSINCTKISHLCRPLRKSWFKIWKRGYSWPRFLSWSTK